MGLATIDPHSQKGHTEIHKIPKFGVNQASFDCDLKKSTLTKKCMASGRCAIHFFVNTAIHFFVNFDIFKRLYLAYVWDLGIL